MTGAALGLILTSAFIHATWNLLAKRAGGGAIFVWSFTTLSSLVLLPVAIGIFVVDRPQFGWAGWGFLCGTAVLHLLYFLLLQRAYRTGDLSLVYPLARGIGPSLSATTAIILFGERPSLLAAAGIVLVIGGVLLLTIRRRGYGPSASREAMVFGILCGVCIATYSVWDKYAVDDMAIPPLLLEAFSGLGVSVMLTPYALQNPVVVREMWHNKWRHIVGVAVLAPLSYILVLIVMVGTPLSHVAPAREISILIGAVLGTRFLGEGQTTRRLIAAGCMVAGVVAIAAG